MGTQKSLFKFECEKCGEKVTKTYEAYDDGSIIHVCAECLDGYTECACCNTFHHTDVMSQTTDEDYICPDCRIEHYYTCCDSCHKYGRDTCIHNVGTRHICQDCIDNHYVCCVMCTQYVHGNDAISTCSGLPICQSCYEDDYFTCARCDEVLHNDYYDCDGFCTACNDSAYDDNIRTYSANAYGILGTRFMARTGINSGIELECTCPESCLSETAENVLSTLGESYVILKEDSSIRPCGFEIVTAPTSMEHVYKRFNRFFDNLPKNLASWKTGTCGMHIHVERKNLSTLDIGKMLVFINDPTNETLIKTIAGRYKNSYAHIEKKKITDVKACQRREALNLQNENTIEFRIFRGTLNRLHFFANFEFVHCLVAYVKHTSMRDISANNFIEYLKKDRKSYINLYDFLAAKNMVSIRKKSKDQNVPYALDVINSQDCETIIERGV